MFLEYALESFAYTFFLVFMWVQGLILGYVLWAPETKFKRSLVDGLSLKFIWKRNK